MNRFKHPSLLCWWGMYWCAPSKRYMVMLVSVDMTVFTTVYSCSPFLLLFFLSDKCWSSQWMYRDSHWDLCICTTGSRNFCLGTGSKVRCHTITFETPLSQPPHHLLWSVVCMKWHHLMLQLHFLSVRLAQADDKSKQLLASTPSKQRRTNISNMWWQRNFSPFHALVTIVHWILSIALQSSEIAHVSEHNLKTVGWRSLN